MAATAATTTLGTASTDHVMFLFHCSREALLSLGVSQVQQLWEVGRVRVLAPALRVAIAMCLVASVLMLVEKVVLAWAAFTVKAFRIRPEKRYKSDPLMPDPETGNLAYPMVLVQIPMYNEREVYKLSIGAACGLQWPSDRMIIQVLDDSTDPIVKDLVERECRMWKGKGMNIHYEVRGNREGYKAGALKEGMKHPYVNQCDYIAMFDADFQPEPDFLTRTIPFLAHNPDIALVQARWKFVNADECLLTRMQEMSLDYHFKVEQEAGSWMFAFFGFNGTAGVWRISAMEDAGGWNDRTIVEDMDLAVRAGIKGWKFVYVGDVMVKSELPSTFKAYRTQQHRWSCGPAKLFKKMAMEIVLNTKVSVLKKLYIILNFFFIAKILCHTVTFIFYCVVLPISVFVPEVTLPLWGVFYVPIVISLCKSVGTPSSFHLIIFWILFENVISFHRIKAATSGLLEVGRVNEWVVTEKLGEKTTKGLTDEGDITKKLIDVGEDKADIVEEAKKPKRRFWHRFHYAELFCSVFLLICGIYDLMYGNEGFFVYIIPQAIAFFVIGVEFIGTSIPL